MDLVAHRGFQNFYLENTFESLNLAAKSTCRWVECDVHQLKGGEWIVFHDAHLKHLAGFNKKIKDFSTEEIKKIELNNGQNIPFLSEILAVVGQKLIIEIKGKFENLDYFTTIKKNTIISFEETLLTANFDNPFIPLIRDEISKLGIEQIKKWVKSLPQRNYLGIGINYLYLNSAISEVLHKIGKIYVWTVDDKTQLNRLKSLGVSFLATNLAEAWINNGQI